MSASRRAGRDSRTWRARTCVSLADMTIPNQRGRLWRWNHLFLGCAAALLVSVGCSWFASSVSPDRTHMLDNCKRNLEAASADLKYCAAKSAGACSSLKQKDLAQLVALYAANKPSADEVSTHLDACQGKGEDNQDCKAAQAAIAQLKCE